MIYVFAGLLILLITNKINGIDITPDFIGYALITFGLYKLKDYSPKFSSAMPWAIGLMIYNLFTFAYVYSGWLIPVNLIIVLGLTAVISQLIIFGIIGAGVKDTENINEVNLGSKKLSITWKLIAIVTILGYVLSYFINYPVAIVISLLLMAVNLVLRIVYIVYIKKTDSLMRNVDLQKL